jgi:hypothetical protein
MNEWPEQNTATLNLGEDRRSSFLRIAAMLAPTGLSSQLEAESGVWLDPWVSKDGRRRCTPAQDSLIEVEGH